MNKTRPLPSAEIYATLYVNPLTWVMLTDRHLVMCKNSKTRYSTDTERAAGAGIEISTGEIFYVLCHSFRATRGSGWVTKQTSYPTVDEAFDALLAIYSRHYQTA